MDDITPEMPEMPESVRHARAEKFYADAIVADLRKTADFIEKNPGICRDRDYGEIVEAADEAIHATEDLEFLDPEDVMAYDDDEDLARA